MKWIAVISSVVLLSACAIHPAAMTTGVTQRVSTGNIANGNAAEGRVVFSKLRCDSCHSLSGATTGAPHPLPDLTAQPPEAVAALITQRGELAPEALFDEMAMSSAVAQMTPRDLEHIVAYLRNPSAGNRSRTR